MTHPIVQQLHFAKEKWLEGHANLPDEDALKRLGHANSIGWMVGHLANFDQLMWCENAQGIKVTDATDPFAFRMPASTPPIADMMAAWHAIQATVNPFLDALTEADMATYFEYKGRQMENYGTVLRRMTWHYWYHLGEMQAIRQAMGHTELPQFVGRMSDNGKYTAPKQTHYALDSLVDAGYDLDKVLAFVQSKDPDFFK